MQAIHVLRAEKHAACAQPFCPLGKCYVCCIGPGVTGVCPAIRVILPHQCRIALPCLDVRQFIVAAAMPVGALKHRDPALSADSGAGEDENTACTLHRKSLDLFDRTIARAMMSWASFSN